MIELFRPKVFRLKGAEMFERDAREMRETREMVDGQPKSVPRPSSIVLFRPPTSILNFPFSIINYQSPSDH